jgi:hypothetical protein
VLEVGLERRGSERLQAGFGGREVGPLEPDQRRVDAVE